MVLNKLTLKYQETYDIVNNFVAADNKHFPFLREYLKKNAEVYQYLYAMLYPKYFCRIDNRGVKSKLAFDLVFAGYKNEQKNVYFPPVKQEVIEIVDNDNNSSVVAEQQQ